MFALAVLAAIPAFAHLTLSSAIEQTIANSAAVAQAETVVRQRQAQLQIARGGGVPHLTGDYSLSPQAGPTGNATVEQHFFTVGAGITLNDVLSARESTRQAAAQLVGAQRDADAAIVQARTGAVGLYFSALQTLAVAGVRADAVAGAQQQARAARIRSGAGAAPQLDVVRADVAVAQAQADLARADADRDNAAAALASAGNVDPALLRETGGSIASPQPPLDETRAVARALAMRPELASLRASLDAARSGIALAKQSGLPTVTAGAGYQAGVDTAVPVRGPQAAVHLDLPLDAGARAKVEIAQAQADAIVAQLHEAQRTIALDVAVAVRNTRAAAAAMRAADRARDEAQRALGAVELGYREGASSGLDVEDARRTSVGAAVDALIAEYQYAQALEQLEAMLS